jgi:hypothetical protein
MRKLLMLLIALASIIFAVCSPASAQMMLTGAGCVKAQCGGGGGTTLNFVSQNVWSLQSGGTQTISGVNIGTASSNRRVIIAVLETASYGTGITAITVGGVSCTLNGPTLNNASYNGSIVFGYCDAPTGTTATVVITGGGTSGDEAQDVFYIYTVDKSTLINGSPTYGTNAIISGSPTTTNTATVNTGANGFVITAIALPGFTTSTGQSITASTETYVNDGLNGASQNTSAISSKKSGSSANTPTSVTWSWTNSAGSVVAVYAWN